MNRLLDWLNLGDHLNGVTHAAAGLACLGLVLGALFQATPLAPMTAGAGTLSMAADTDEPVLEPQSYASVVLAAVRATQIGVTSEENMNAAAEFLSKEQSCLATGIYFEARGESYSGQRAVAEVILNRVASKNYPDTICGVVFQGASRRTGCQFSFACDGKPDTPKNRLAWRKAERLAKLVTYNAADNRMVGSATHYHADYVQPRWAGSLTEVAKIGRHIFYITPEDIRS